MKNDIKQQLRMMLGEDLKDNIAIVKKSDLEAKNNKGVSNWSAEYQVSKKLGKEPYELVGFQFVPIDTSYKVKKAIYLRPNEANELNSLGKGVADLMNLFNEKRKEYKAFSGSEKSKHE
jgi:hypothetical protein